MGLPNVMGTGRSGMMASKTAISTSGHNITNANTEGFSRQRVEFKTNAPAPSFAGNNGVVGRGVLVAGVDRINDEYLEKQVSVTVAKILLGHLPFTRTRLQA